MVFKLDVNPSHRHYGTFPGMFPKIASGSVDCVPHTSPPDTKPLDLDREAKARQDTELCADSELSPMWPFQTQGKPKSVPSPLTLPIRQVVACLPGCTGLLQHQPTYSSALIQSHCIGKNVDHVKPRLGENTYYAQGPIGCGCIRNRTIYTWIQIYLSTSTYALLLIVVWDACIPEITYQDCGLPATYLPTRFNDF
jgi:hypothetical protein